MDPEPSELRRSRHASPIELLSHSSLRRVRPASSCLFQHNSCGDSILIAVPGYSSGILTVNRRSGLLKLGFMAVSSDISIPPELFDMIIDHLHDDKHSLATCGRICRQWVPSSRKHLFSSITLTPYSEMLNLFLDLLDCPLTNIPPHVRNLSVEGRGHVDKLQWSVEDLSRLPQRLYAIDSLSFVTVGWRDMSPEFRSAALPLFNRVTNLGIKYFTNLICMFPSLQELFLTSIVLLLPNLTMTINLPSRLTRGRAADAVYPGHVFLWKENICTRHDKLEGDES